MEALASILADESAGLGALPGRREKLLAARLNELGNYAHTAEEAIKGPSPDEVHSDYREINSELRAHLRSVRIAARSLRSEGCRPPARLARLLVAHAFY